MRAILKSTRTLTPTPRRRSGDNPSRAIHDAWWLLAVSLLTLVVSIRIEAIELLMEFAEQHEAWELDEFFAVFIVTSLGGFIYSLRRWKEVRRELSLRKEAEDRIQALAMQDPLTELPNRRKLRHELEHSMARVAQGKESLALIAVDLDRFKPVNDLYGHAVGDAVLVAVSAILKDIAGEHGVAARLGGDEFAIVLRDVDEEAAVRAASKILAALDAPLEVAGKSCQIGASLGIAMAPRDADTADLLLRRADVALYRSKAAGRGRFSCFEAGMDDDVRRRAEMERELREAVRLNQIEPFYHSLIDLSTGDLVGLEILARWRHPERGIIPPAMFIPLAEELGLISELSLQLLHQACTDAMKWPDHLTLAINISSVQLNDPWLAERLLQTIVNVGFPAERLEVEITEDALVANLDAARSVILSLKNQGVRVVLDDFGTGYSSLQYLRELPFDMLKIDRSFVQCYEADEESRTIVTAIIGLAKNLDLVVTASGIETCENRDRLRDLGCAMGQGFLYGEPADATSIDTMLGLDDATNGSAADSPEPEIEASAIEEPATDAPDAQNINQKGVR